MDRRSVDARIIALAGANGMVLTAGQLTKAGIGHHYIESRRGGMLIPVARGVYAVGEVTPAVRLRAVLAAMPVSAGSHTTAGRSHGLPLRPGDVVDVTTTRRTKLVIDGVRIRTTTWLPPDDVTTIEGVRLTTVARTLCDLAAVVARGRLQHVLEVAIATQKVAAGEVQACAAAWCRRGRAGSGVIRALDHELLDDEPMAASELERRAARLLREAGLEGWQAQYRPPWYDGLRGIVDGAWPELKVVLELDGRRWHATAQAQVEDRRRDRAAIAHGWITLRFGWQEIVHRPASVVDECRLVLRARRRAAAAG